LPRNPLIHEAVHARALAHPDATALIHPGGSVSYQEIDRWSDEIAGTLAEAGVRPGTVVPVLLPPSAHLVATLLGVLKSGAAYAALEAGWPDQRLADIAALLPGQVAVTGADAGPLFAGRRIVVHDDSAPTVQATTRPPKIVAADGTPAMVFFTSGSSGAPKAVLSPHRAVMRLFSNCTFARFDQTTVMAQVSAVPWDAFAMEVWGPLTTGGVCVVITDRPLTPAGLREAVTRHGVNTLFLTTSLFHLVVEEDLAAFAGLHTVIAGGEKFSAGHAGQVIKAWPDLRLVNGYGPVESAVFALTHDVRPDDVHGEIPLGRPVPRTEVVLMRTGEPFGTPCPDGEIGEICVGGDGLALSYLGDPELTARKFVTTLVDGSPTRLYRTGDLGLRDTDGVLHFHGRLDRQVKVRGHRLEPEGIERVAGDVPGVRRSVVTPQRDSTGNVEGLVLFYLPADGRPTEQELTAALRQVLPGYSVPDRIVAVPALPVTTTGKIDTAALLAGLGERVTGSPQGPVAGYVGDGTDVERAIAAEVTSLLGLSDVGRSASIFGLGATSLTVVRLCARLGTRFDRAIPMSRVMRDPTVRGIAAWLATPVDGGPGAGEADREAALTPV
jgi:mycobactin peptide synthetase MbtE